MSETIKVRVPEETLKFFTSRKVLAEKDLAFADEMHSSASKALTRATAEYTSAMDFNGLISQSVKDEEQAVEGDPRGETELLHHLRVVLKAADAAVIKAADDLTHYRQVMLAKHNRVIQLQSDRRVVESILERIEIE